MIYRILLKSSIYKKHLKRLHPIKKIEKKIICYQWKLVKQIYIGNKKRKDFLHCFSTSWKKFLYILQALSLWRNVWKNNDFKMKKKDILEWE